MADVSRNDRYGPEIAVDPGAPCPRCAHPEARPGAHSATECIRNLRWAIAGGQQEVAVLRAALAGLLDADDPCFCQGEQYVAEDEQAECMACPWCHARVALGRGEANAPAIGTPSHEDVLRLLAEGDRAAQQETTNREDT